MLANLPRVVREAALALGLVGRLEGVEVRGQRRLRVDDDVLSAGDPDDEVRSQRAVLGRRARLRHVVAVLDHPGELDDVPQLRLAPAPAHMRRAERVREASRSLGERRDLGLQGAVRLLSNALDGLQLLIHALRASPSSGRTWPDEVRLGELEEPRAVRVERLPRERLDRRLESLVSRAALDGELRLGSRERPLELDDLLHAPPPLDESGPDRDEDAEPPSTRPMTSPAMTIEPTHGNPVERTAPLTQRGLNRGRWYLARGMADKPRVKAPKQRAVTADESAHRRKTMAIVAGVAGLVLGFVVVAAALGMFGGSGGTTDVAGLRTTLKDAGCTLQVAPALEGVHSITDPSQTSPKWNTDPPTSGPHYAIAAIFGIYEDELEMARVVHNLEHGGIYILYGKDVPDATVEQLRSFYEDHQTGTIMAPLDRLGDNVRARRVGRRRRHAQRLPREVQRVRRERHVHVLPLAPVPRARALRSEPAPARDVGGRRVRAAGVAERVRRARLKSGCPLGGVRVRVPPPAPRETRGPQSRAET